MNKYKVVIEGAYGEKNFGDDALLRVIYKFIEHIYKEDEILIITKTKALNYSLEQFSRGSDIETIDNIKCLAVDNIIYGGGTQFFKFDKSNSLTFKAKQALNNPRLIFSFVKKKIFKCSLVGFKHYIGIGLGPFEKVNDFQKLNVKFNDSVSFFVRDKQSEYYAKKIGVKNVKKYTDICFAEKINILKENRLNKHKKVGIILRDWEHTNFNFNVDNTIVELNKIEDIEFEYIVLGNDKELLKDLNRNDVKYSCYDPDNISFNDFLKYLSSFDLVITSRYHGVIYSILLGIPFIALNIEPKLEIAAKELGAISIISRNTLSELSDIVKNINYKKEIEKVEETKNKQHIIAINMLECMRKNFK